MKKVEVPLVFWTTADCLTKDAGYRRQVVFCMQSSKFSFLLPLLCNSSSLSIYPYAAGGSKAQTSNEDCRADVTDARGRNFGKIPCCCDEGPDGGPAEKLSRSRKWCVGGVLTVYSLGTLTHAKDQGALFGPSRTKKTYECESNHKHETVMRSWSFVYTWNSDVLVYFSVHIHKNWYSDIWHCVHIDLRR